LRRNVGAVVETNRTKTAGRLQREGWTSRSDGGHDVFKHPTKAGRIVLPRHREVSIGVARVVAKQAGWLQSDG
jgi:predicted RNA binding protein YcfA (HicA-like mRNA interferase family)